MPPGIGATALRIVPEIDPVEYCHQQGWTDGLPVVPPTPERVEAMLAGAAREARDVVGLFPPMGGEATVEKVAINAVMAGCLPEYFPVVLTAAECLAQGEGSLGALLTTVHGDAPLLIINGPVSEALGFNSGSNTFGPGWRANATVGRAIALLMRNVAVGPPGAFDVATQTHPGKFTACIAEFERVSPWPPLHVEWGFDARDSTVTVIGAHGPQHVTDMVSTTPKGVLTTLADCMATMGSYNMYRGGEVIIVMSPTHAHILAGQGWSKDDARYYLWEKARRPLGTLRRGGSYNFGGVLNWPRWVDADDDGYLVPVAHRPQDIMIVVAGGEVGGYSSIVFCLGLRSTTRRVPIPAE